MDIGSKIKKARLEAKLTQEDVVQHLNVSRQTISNWENEKTYPDIISVVKMSDLYMVSLDYLLKEDKPMTKYLDHIDKTTNIVKSKERQAKLIITIAYLLIWSFSILVFWIFNAKDDAIGYSLMYLWILLPTTIFSISLIISRNTYYKKQWVVPIVFGISYMLAEYATFSTANMVSFEKINVPNFLMIVIGAAISSLGLLIGIALDKKNK